MPSENAVQILSQPQERKLAKLETSILALAEKKADIRFDGKVASTGTVRNTIYIAKESAKRLHRLGFELESIDKLGDRPIRALVQDWEKCGLFVSTRPTHLEGTGAM